MPTVKPLLPGHATADVHRFVDVLRARLGEHELVVADGWEAFAGACGARSRDSVSGAAPLVIGPVEAVIEQLQVDGFSGQAIGFVMPAAIKPPLWKRAPARFLDPTRALWRAGWSPLAIERVDVPGDDGVIEVVIGNARPTPASVSAFDDAN